MPFVHHLISGAIDYFTKRDPPPKKLHFPSRRHFYYALVRTFHEGSEATATHSARPPLPLELIIQILRDAECTVLSRLSRRVGKTIGDMSERFVVETFLLPTSGWPLPLINGKRIYFWKETRDLCNIISRDANPVGRNWFSTPPLSAHDLANTHSMQLLTFSSDWGHLSTSNAGRWGWFGIVLTPCERERPNRVVWLSHSNSRPASVMRRCAGTVFGPSHEIWQIAQIGDRIDVRAYAQSNGWLNFASVALLILQEYFIPSFVPR